MQNVGSLVGCAPPSLKTRRPEELELTTPNHRFVRLLRSCLLVGVLASCGFTPDPEEDDDRDDPVLDCEEAGATCRASLDECDTEEVCADAASDCPENSTLTDDTPCSVGSCQVGFCMPDGTMSAYWPLNGSVADVALDSSVNKHDGIKHGAPMVVPGTFGDALRFDGIGDAIEVADFSYGQNFTVSLWFSTSEAKRHMLLNHAEGEGVGAIEIAVERDGAVTIAADDGVGGGLFAKSEKIGQDGAWHFVVLRVADGTASAFFDGALLSSAPIGAIDPGGALMLGARESLNPDSLLLGDLDDVRIYEQTFTARELVELYIEGDGRLVRLRPVADSEVRGGAFSDVPQGTDNSMQIKVDNPDTTYLGLMRFDLSSIPTTIVSATLTLHVSYRGTVTGMQNAVATLASDDWSEEDVTFATMPAVGQDIALWLVPLADADELINLTDLTRAELAGDGVLSFAIRSVVDLDGEGYVGYNTRESNFIPTLTLELSAQ